MAQRNVQDEGLFPGVDLLAMAIQAEKQEKAEKQQRQEMYLQGLQLRRQQEASALAAQREARIANENQRKADYRTQIDVENLKTNRARLNLDERRLSWDQERTNAMLVYKQIAETRALMQHRADMALKLNTQMYSKVLTASDPKTGFAEAKKDLQNTRNSFAALRSAIQWWDRNPTTRGRVVSNPNDALFNQVWEIPGVKESLNGLNKEQQDFVQSHLTQYAALPEEERANFLKNLTTNEEVASGMSQAYQGFQDPKQAMQIVQQLIDKTNADIDYYYQHMPSFYGFNPSAAQQPAQEARPTLDRAASYSGEVGAAYGSPSRTTSAPSTTMPTSAPSSKTKTQEGLTNDEGYFDDEEGENPTEGGQTNELGYYDDEEE